MVSEKQLVLWIKISLLLVCAYIGSGIVVQLLRTTIPAPLPVVSHGKDSSRSAAEVSRLEDYAVIWEKNMFGAGQGDLDPELQPAEVETVEVSEEAEKEIDLPLTSLNYLLMGTVVGPPSNSFAIIAGSGDKEQRLYRKGDTLGGAEIRSIRRNAVIIDNKGREEMLEVKFDEKAMAGRVSSPAAVTPGRGVRKLSANKFILDRNEVEKLSGDVSQFMTQVRIVPNFVQGKASGYKMMNIKKGSLVESVGFVNGDVLKEINGKSINRPEDAFHAYEQLKKGGGFTLDIERKGKRETLYYEVR